MHVDPRRWILPAALALFTLAPARFSFALHIVPDHPGDVHFTAGPSPTIVPKDGAVCPNGAATCPSFHDPALLPAGYDSVSYCAEVPAGIGFQSPGLTLLTMPLDAREQKAFLIAAKRAESFVKDDVTVVIEPYKVAYLDADGNKNVIFGGNEYWNPVCGSDALLPPYASNAPTILANPDGSYSYQDLPESYTVVLDALKAKNARNRTPMRLIDYLPTQQQIDVEWPSTFVGWQADTNYQSDSGKNYLVAPSDDVPIPPDAKPFTLCSSPAVMKMLGLAPLFLQNGHCIDDINAPARNMNVTLEGTDGALVIPDVTAYPPVNTARPWIYDSSRRQVVDTQLPKAFFEKTYDQHLPDASCGDPSQCRFPSGVDPGTDLVGTMSHEINHILGIMQSQYYKARGNATSLVYTYGTALYLLDLFDLDSDAVVDGFGYPGIHSRGDFTLAPRNNDTYVPTTIYVAPTPSELTPWVQFGSRDHVMVYDVIGGAARYFPLMNYLGLMDPDGDVQQQFGFVETPNPGNLFFVDPELANMPSTNVVHGNVQAGTMRATISVDTIREYSELAAQGWDIKYSTLSPSTYTTVSPLAKWYQTCFDANGALTTAKNAHCKFSVLPADLKAIR